MDKNIMIIGIFATLAIVGIVLFVNSTISGNVVGTGDEYAFDYYVARPWSGMQFRTESGVVVMQGEQVINQVCRNSVFCDGKASYVCCNDMGTDCQIPAKADEARGGCPLIRRSKCQCREDYIAGLQERYG